MPIPGRTRTSPSRASSQPAAGSVLAGTPPPADYLPDRKSTRLNSSHSQISYAVFCLQQKNEDLALLDELHGIREQVQDDLAKPALVASDGRRQLAAHLVRQLEAPPRGGRGAEVERDF